MNSASNYFGDLFKEAGALDGAGLTLDQHASRDIHFIGEALPAPSVINNVPAAGTTGSVGDSPMPAREDHIHGTSAINVVYARISQGAGQVVNNVTNTQVTLATETWDYGDFHVGSNRLTATVAGFYDFTYFGLYSDTVGAFRVAFWMETSRDAVRYAEQYDSAHNPGHGFTGSETIWLDVGQYVRLMTYHNRGATYDILAARLTGVLVRECLALV